MKAFNGYNIDSWSYNHNDGIRTKFGSKINIDLKCFYTIGLMPDFIKIRNIDDCISLIDVSGCNKEYINKKPLFNMIPITDIFKCEQGITVENIKIINEKNKEKEILMHLIKSIVTTGVSYIPIFGPVLGAGIDLTWTILSDPSEYVDAIASTGLPAKKELVTLDINKFEKIFLQILSKGKIKKRDEFTTDIFMELLNMTDFDEIQN